MKKENRIPKIVHYIWFGHGEKSEKVKKCIESWKKFLPDYEIREWNEDNFNIFYNKFTKQAYKVKKWAFVSDVARLWVLYNYGGIYMDTDVEVYKSLDEFLDEEAFTGFEDINYPVNATFGSRKGNLLVKELLDYYDDKDFTDLTNTKIISNIFEEKGIDRTKNEIQSIEGITVYPIEYFNNEKGYTKHHMEGSWLK